LFRGVLMKKTIRRIAVSGSTLIAVVLAGGAGARWR